MTCNRPVSAAWVRCQNRCTCLPGSVVGHYNRTGYYLSFMLTFISFYTESNYLDYALDQEMLKLGLDRDLDNSNPGIRRAAIRTIEQGLNNVRQRDTFFVILNNECPL